MLKTWFLMQLIKLQWAWLFPNKIVLFARLLSERKDLVSLSKSRFVCRKESLARWKYVKAEKITQLVACAGFAAY